MTGRFISYEENDKLEFLIQLWIIKNIVLISAFCGEKKETDRFMVSLRRTTVGHNYIWLVHTTLPWFSTQVTGLNPWVGRSGECFASFDLFYCRCCSSVETCALQAFIKQTKNSVDVSFCEDSFLRNSCPSDFYSFRCVLIPLPSKTLAQQVGAALGCMPAVLLTAVHGEE